MKFWARSVKWFWLYALNVNHGKVNLGPRFLVYARPKIEARSKASLPRNVLNLIKEN